MPTVKNRELPGILQAMQVLAQREIPMGGAMHLRKLYCALAAHWGDVDALRKELLRRYAQCDTQGRMIENPPGNPVWNSPADGAAADAAFEELMDGTFSHPHTLHPKKDLGYDRKEEEAGQDPKRAKTMLGAILIGLGPFLEDEDEDEEGGVTP